MNAPDFATRVAAVTPLKPASAKGPVVTATPYEWRDPEGIPLRRWIYGRQLLRGSVSVIVAPGATGKTALMIGTAMCLVTGLEHLGQRVWGGPKRVWLWNLEDSTEEITRAVQAAALRWGIGREDIGDRLFVDSGVDGAELKIAVEGPDGAQIVAPVIEALIAELEARRIDVLIVDPFVSSHSVSENDNGAIDAIAKQWARVAIRANCAIVLVHHSRKLGGGEVSAETARGASALIAAARSAMALNRMSEDEAKRFGIEGEERRRYFRTYDDKNNRAPPADRSEWFQLESVSLGNGENGGDSLGVVAPWSPPDAFDGVSPSHLRAVQDLLDTGIYRASNQTSPWAGEAVAQALGFDLSRSGDKAKVNALLKTWTANGALRVEMKRDGKSNDRPFLVVGKWVEADVSPPSRSGVRTSEEARTSHLPTTTPLYRGGGGGEGGHRRGSAGGETSPSHWKSNPALGRNSEQPDAASDDDFIEGWDQ